MNDNEIENALKEVLNEDDYNEYFNVHRYFGWRKDLEYLWETQIVNKSQLYHRFCPFNGEGKGDTVIEMWDRKLIRKGLENWSEKDEEK